MYWQEITFGGDDWLCARFNADAYGTMFIDALQSASKKLRDSGLWIEVVPSTHDISVRFDAMAYMPTEAQTMLFQQIKTIELHAHKKHEVIRIPVCYGGTFGLDIQYCANTLSLTAENIIEHHTAEPFLIQMMGFAPGFAYCGEICSELEMPRLDEPRTYVAAGSIGITGRQTCIYSLAGPGGWPLIGCTPLNLFDAHADVPFLLKAGIAVHFYEIDESEFYRLQHST